MFDDGVTERRVHEPPWTDNGVGGGVSDCYDLVMLLSLDGGLSQAEADNVSRVTLLRMADQDPDFERLTPARTACVLRLALEQRVVARQLRGWREARHAGALGGLVPA